MVKMTLDLRKVWTSELTRFCRPVAHYGRVGVSLAGEGDPVPLQDGARLDGQGHDGWIWKRGGDSL